MKATVVNTVENTTKVVELPEVVDNLAGLKRFLNIRDGQFFEGTTHTDLTSDTQTLPQLPESKKERGYVFFVSPAQNKIKNGAYDRKTCYSIIKSHNLGNKVKEEFGRNFTQVGTDALNKFIAINADVDGSESVSTPNEQPHAEEVVAPAKNESLKTVEEASDALTTEKELWETVSKMLSCTDDTEFSKLEAQLNEGIKNVFPNPYSVQDLTNMRK